MDEGKKREKREKGGVFTLARLRKASWTQISIATFRITFAWGLGR